MANGENHMRGIDVGSRKAIIVKGVLVGTFLTYKDKTTFVTFNEGGKPSVRIMGPVDGAEAIAKLDMTTVKDSFFVVKCVYLISTDQVKITLKHNVLPMWDCEYVVDRTGSWVTDFYMSFNAAQRLANRETHISNRGDMLI